MRAQTHANTSQLFELLSLISLLTVHVFHCATASVHKAVKNKIHVILMGKLKPCSHLFLKNVLGDPMTSGRLRHSAAYTCSQGGEPQTSLTTYVESIHAKVTFIRTPLPKTHQNTCRRCSDLKKIKLSRVILLRSVIAPQKICGYKCLSPQWQWSDQNTLVCSVGHFRADCPRCVLKTNGVKQI